MSWTLLIVIVVGTLTADPRLQTIPMKTDLACKAAALKLLEPNSSKIAMFCINSDSGEVFEVKK